MTDYTLDDLREWLGFVPKILAVAAPRFALMGGAAVMVYAVRPSTRDIDFLCVVDDIAWLGLDGAFTNQGCRVDHKAQWHKRVWRGPMYADLIRCEVPLQKDAVITAEIRDVARVQIPVVAPEYLIALKRIAGRPRDLRDIESIREHVAGIDDAAIASLLAPFGIEWP